MKKENPKRALRNWHEKGKADAFFGMEPMTLERATLNEKRAYQAGYAEGREQRLNQEKVERNA